MSELIAEGLLGDNLDFKWEFKNDGTLTITGKGVLKFSSLPAEWEEELANAEKFQRIVYSEGITEIITDMSQYDLPRPYVLELPSTLYYIEGYLGGNSSDNAPLIVLFHSKIPPRGYVIYAKIVYVPFDSLDVYKATKNWDVVMTMPPVFEKKSCFVLKETNHIYCSLEYSVYSMDGSLVLHSSGNQLIKKAGDYMAITYNGVQQRIRILADYIEPTDK